MNDETVKKKLDNMVAFIIREAHDKANEINVTAEEEKNIEKQRIVQEEKIKITKEYERKEKQEETKKKIQESNEKNQSRLKILKAREEALDQIYHETVQRLNHISESADYKDLLKNLIVQGLMRLGEPVVSVSVREVDAKLAESVLNSAAELYHKKTNKTVSLSIDRSHPLPPPPSEKRSGPSSAGGVLLSANEGKVLCNNTLEQRLTLAFEQLLPQIRLALFGRSAGRVHDN